MTPEVGSQVEVHFTGTVISDASCSDLPGTHLYYKNYEGFFAVKDQRGVTHLLWATLYDAEDEVFTVTEAPGPVGWPVEIGDIWIAMGEEYFVHEMSGELYVEPFNDVPYLDTYGYFGVGSLGEFKTLNPVLVRRR